MSSESVYSIPEGAVDAASEFAPWRAEDYIHSDEDAIGFLNAALEERDSATVQDALGIVARARGMSRIARGSGLGRESLYKALRPNAHPSFDTILRVADTLGAQMYFLPADIDLDAVYDAVEEIKHKTAVAANSQKES